MSIAETCRVYAQADGKLAATGMAVKICYNKQDWPRYARALRAERKWLEAKIAAYKQFLKT